MEMKCFLDRSRNEPNSLFSMNYACSLTNISSFSIEFSTYINMIVSIGQVKFNFKLQLRIQTEMINLNSHEDEKQTLGKN